MAFILEDGSGVAGANSYISEDAFDNYCEDHGITPADGDTEAAAIRGTAAIDATYRGRFPGYKIKYREQGLEWPRTVAYDNDGNLIVADQVPIEIIHATCEATIREKAAPGSMMPDLERGGNIKRLKAGSVEIEYAGNAEARSTYTLIDGLLSGILNSGSGGGMFGVAVRG